MNVNYTKQILYQYILQPQLRPRHEKLVDGENKPVTVDILYTVQADALIDTLEEIKRIHGPRFYLLPLSGASGGGGIFQVDGPGDGSVIGLRFMPAAHPRIRRCGTTDITRLSLDQIVIDEKHRRVYAGSCITLQQLNQALSDELGPQFKVLGADLTSYTYAQVGATFMTGGMGPQRRYFSDSVNEIALYDGEEIVHIKAEALAPYAGTYGWSGLIAAVCCSYHELPAAEFAFTLPVNNTPDDLARLLLHLSRFTYLRSDDGKVTSVDGGTNLILGVEHITLASMQPMFSQHADNAVVSHARRLAQNCVAADTDGLVFINGCSNLTADEFLLGLVDDPEAQTFTIAGIDLEHTEMFGEPEEMRAVREGIPAAARAQSPHGEYLYKGHTDATIKLNPKRVEQTMRELWQANQTYIGTVETYFQAKAELRGEILIYGHLNPVGVDPHNRVTFACDHEGIYLDARAYIEHQRDRFFRALGVICEQSESVYIGGEKSAGTEHEIFSAFNGIDNAPPALRRKFAKQSAVIRAASPMFNWRALAPYV